MGVRKDKEAYNTYMREYNKNNPNKRKHGDLKKKYGISFDQYKDMWDAQGGLCFICKQPETQVHPINKQPYMLSVDHCHKSGEIRKLLCNRYNRTLGMVNDDIELLKSMVVYLGV